MSSKMSAETNALNWFEIPVTDIGRASKFYETIFEIQLIPMEMMGMKMAMFPTNGLNGTAGGSLTQSDMHYPSDKGTIVYLNANPDLQLVLDRTTNAGGSVAMPKTFISEETGYMAFVIDTEGNAVGLHSNQ
jgi:predicted enzyme related to lactoylglutathione lyase